MKFSLFLLIHYRHIGSVPDDSSFGFSSATPSTGLAAVSAAVGEYGTYLKSLILLAS
jgi:hypothetical protein